MMAAFTGSRKGVELSKAEYLKRYLSADENAKKSTEKIKKKRRKVQEKGLKIVDDDIDWKQIVCEQHQQEEEDEEEAPVIAEVIDERPDEVKQLEAFRTSNRWKVIGADENEDTEEGTERGDQPQEPGPSGSGCYDSPDISLPRKARHDSPDISPPGRSHHNSLDLSTPRQQLGKSGKKQHKDSSPFRKKHSSSRKKCSLDDHHSKESQNRHDSDSDQSPPRKKPGRSRVSDYNQSPPRRHSEMQQGSDSDQSPPRTCSETQQGFDSDQSPPRRWPQGRRELSPACRLGQSQGPRMLSGGKAGLVSVDVLRKEKEENRHRERNEKPLEDESCNAQTVFRDKSGKRRDLDSEREEKKKKAGEKAATNEKYAQWGKGLAQGQMQQQKLEDAVHEAQKPLARHYDDEDLDRLLREQERDGDPMAAMLRRKKDSNTKTQDKPRYNGPAPPPNRFNIMPGYRWDGVDRSNGFENKRYMRISDKKANQEAAYKWSVEDM